MKNYTAVVYDPYTFEPTEFETNIPETLVDVLMSSTKLLSEEWFITPTMVEPDHSSVGVGVRFEGKKYKIQISVVE